MLAWWAQALHVFDYFSGNPLARTLSQSRTRRRTAFTGCPSFGRIPLQRLGLSATWRFNRNYCRSLSSEGIRTKATLWTQRLIDLQ